MEKHHAHGQETHAGHNHSHAGHHSHGAVDTHNRAFLIATILNAGFVIVEFAYGVMANSTALIADAGHNLSDVLGLILAWGAALLSRKSPTRKYTYGLRGSSILASLGNAMLLLVACGAIAWEAVHRFSEPATVSGLTVSVVAGVGILINSVSAMLFVKGSKGDLNIRGAFMHMAADAAVSLGVVLAGIAIYYTGWHWIDPILSLIIVAVIMLGTWSLLRDSVELALNAVPGNVDRSAIESYLRKLAGVTDLHDLHIWGMSTTENALTVHLVLPEGYPGDNFMDEVVHTLKSQYAIHHSTIQIEQGHTHHECELT
ncbi:cobalt-zinc-cadmium efflux system protein [Pseudomonas duriflava]|uniref:Cobalt-zinc-cadmium efflux system protein n=1 Tax=Pseudomonas duriflava TaxID=459528 RepID=A0A562PUZ0_9PSED|nr:cation diffusion facilitator family transporter [Pseudomonas duriflava]TWI48255.1 cobalt-zinc-cadmium efflux system protein [Pseudomonas duriflava]